MSSISQVSDALKRVLTARAKELERETGFVERSTAQSMDRSSRKRRSSVGWTPQRRAIRSYDMWPRVWVSP